MAHLIDKDALVAEKERMQDAYIAKLESRGMGHEEAVMASISYINGINDIINSFEVKEVQEEPVSIDFEQELYKAFGQVKDFTLGMRIAKWFYDMGKNNQEPVSEDLEEAAMQYAKLKHKDANLQKIVSWDFKAGAKWQKEQIATNTADATIGLPYENKDGGYTHLIDVSRPLPVGNNKIAIIFKED